MARDRVFIANWKMNKTINEALSFIKELVPNPKSEVMIAAPYTVIAKAVDAVTGKKIVIGAQNMYPESDGAFTGEISAHMLKDVGAKFVLLGHSERRQLFQESNEFINKKIKKAIQEQLRAVLCIGETLDEHENHETEEVLKTQLDECLQDITDDELSKMIIAYEPVWAIGTGLAATSEQAEKAHAFIRKWVNDHRSAAVADSLRVLYGGSVKPDNIHSLLSCIDIDGALVGGASLKVDSFNKIIGTS